MMRALSKATAEKYALIAEMYEAGHKNREIMEKFKVSESVLFNALKRMGVAANRAQLSAAQIAERNEHIFAAYALGGRSRREIASTFKVSLTIVSQIINLAMRSRSGRETFAAAQGIQTYPASRDPCFRCGVRADIGCKHQPLAS